MTGVQTCALPISLSGKVTDDNSATPIANAQVQLLPTNKTAITDEAGNYSFKGIENGNYTLQITTTGYKISQTPIRIHRPKNTMNVAMAGDKVALEEVVVQSIKADKNSATTFTNITAKDIKAGNLGQDLPFLLNSTPSVVISSDAGAGVGYTGIRIRGTDPSRINVTINGVPINDPEDHGTWWVNMPDLASSVGNIQIQRGVGTSTNGAAAFGASLNIQTNNLSKVAFGQLSSSAGSFNTLKNTFQAGSGLINNKFAFETRLSKITSDGFIDRASADLKSFFLSGAYYGKKSVLKTTIFSGREKTYQAWNGVPEDTLMAGNRRYNEFTYPNQTDNYQQDFYQLIYTKEIANNFNINATLFYTRGRGYYEEYKTEQKLSKYQISNVVVGADTLTKTNLVRQKWLDNHFYGFTMSGNYDNKKKLKASIGGGWNQFLGGHYGKVIWAQFANNSNLGDKYYSNDATKDDGNVYGKVYYQLLPKVNVFADLQGRAIGYTFLGVDKDGIDLTQTVNYVFFNPKAGFTWDISQNHYFYTSSSVGQKEPTRGDFVNASPERRPKSEYLTNIESGIVGRRSMFNYAANFYLMSYKNQLVVTGQLDDVGNSLRRNVDNSYRAGIELQLGAKISELFTANLNLTLSKNKIKQFKEILYDENYTENINAHTNTDIAMSPNVILGGQLVFTPLKGLVFTVLPKYVGKQFLDNTSNDTRALKAYFVTDARINYEVPQKLIKNLSFAVQVNNVFNKKYEANGATYPGLYEGIVYNYNYYYPQAGTNFLAGATVKF